MNDKHSDCLPGLPVRFECVSQKCAWVMSKYLYSAFLKLFVKSFVDFGNVVHWRNYETVCIIIELIQKWTDECLCSDGSVREGLPVLWSELFDPARVPASAGASAGSGERAGESERECGEREGCERGAPASLRSSGGDESSGASARGNVSLYHRPTPAHIWLFL